MLEGSLQHKTIVCRQSAGELDRTGNDLFVNPEKGKMKKTDRRILLRIREMVSTHL